MSIDPDDMDEADDSAYWLELHEGGDYTIHEGDTKEESEVVFEGEGWFTAAIQEVVRNVGDFDSSRQYKLRNDDVDGTILLWGKANLNSKIDNAALETGDTVALKFAGTEDVGEANDMHVYDVRYDRM